ncbi:MAG: hypothetical protein ACRDGG_06350 [Anaerolineae bacterium]
MVVLAAFTTLSGILVGAHSILVPEGSRLWIAVKLAACAALVATGTMTWFYVRLQPARLTVAWPLLLGAMGIMVLGAAGSVWTVHLAEVTGDFEAWGLVINLVMIIQGALTTWHLWSVARETRWLNS